eukprot:gene143-biopygen133
MEGTAPVVYEGVLGRYLPLRGRGRERLLAYLQRYGELIQLSWAYNKALDASVTTGRWRSCSRLGPYLAGAKLCGAGGGGYLYLVAKSPAAAAAVRQQLAADTLRHTSGTPQGRVEPLLCDRNDVREEANSAMSSAASVRPPPQTTRCIRGDGCTPVHACPPVGGSRAREARPSP